MPVSGSVGADEGIVRQAVQKLQIQDLVCRERSVSVTGSDRNLCAIDGHLHRNKIHTYEQSTHPDQKSGYYNEHADCEDFSGRSSHIGGEIRGAKTVRNHKPWISRIVIPAVSPVIIVIHVYWCIICCKNLCLFLL